MRTVIIMAFFMAYLSSAKTVTFQPDGAVGKDSDVSYQAPDTNTGDATMLACGRLGLTSIPFSTFIEFTRLDSVQYQNVAVNSARLELYVYGYSLPSTVLFDVGACSTHWDENTITWSNMPGVYESFKVSYLDSVGWISLDVTEYVANWLDGTWDNNGFSLFAEEGSSYNLYNSSDYLQYPNLCPKLILDYSLVTAIKAATWAGIKASF